MEGQPIAGTTKICGIIGDPIEHTMSPVMHNAAFRHLGLDCVYLPFRVGKEAVGRAIEGVKALNIRGLNVTIPHKTAVIPYLDGLDPMAERMGAVNTIVNDNGILTGYNTDAAGFLRALQENKIEPRGANIVVLGAGGASRGISFLLAENGADLTILNRSRERAEDLASQVSTATKTDVKALALDEENLSLALEGANVLVNTTRVGMVPDVNQTPVPSGRLRPDMAVFDIVYNPVKTRLLADAEAVGAQTIGGLEMLVWQGALAFTLWTGQAAPVDLMRKVALKALGHED